MASLWHKQNDKLSKQITAEHFERAIVLRQVRNQLQMQLEQAADQRLLVTKV